MSNYTTCQQRKYNPKTSKKNRFYYNFLRNKGKNVKLHVMSIKKI